MAAPRSEPLSINTQFMSNFNVGSRFTELRPIGYGANGLVFAGIDSECEKHVAIKKISFHDQISCKFALREIKIMRGLEHESIVKVHECLGPDGTSLETVGPDLHAVYIIQELLDTDLHCLIQSGQLTEQHAQLFIYQLLRGLKYLHSANVLHRDLKPSNLLVNYDDLTLKITDFGLSRILDPHYNHKGFLTENLGTTWYRSPEHVITPKDYDSSVDMWSAGCIFGEMLLGRPLFPGAHEINQLHLILDSIELEESDWNHVMRWLPNKLLKNHPLQTRTPLRERMPDVHPLAMDLLERLLRFNPADRLTAEEALTHPYFLDLYCANDEPVVVNPFLIEHEVDDLSPTTLKEMIVSEVVQHTVSCGQKVSAEAALPSKIVNKNLRNQLIHNKVTLEKCNVNTDATGTPIVTESKMTDFSLSLTDDDNIPVKVEFFQETSSDSSSSKQFSIEEVNSNDESSDCEKESYQSMLEHLNKLNMAKSLIETPKKKKAEAILKKEVEKGYDDEKDTAEYSSRKYEEDQELNIMKIKFDNECNEMYGYTETLDMFSNSGAGDMNVSKKSAEPLLIEDFMFPRTNTVIDLELKQKSQGQNRNQEEDYPNCMKKLRFDALMGNNDEIDSSMESYKLYKSINENTKCFESLSIETEEIENFKEFSQPSPKENSDVDELDRQSIWTTFENVRELKNAASRLPLCGSENLATENDSSNCLQDVFQGAAEESNKITEDMNSENEDNGAPINSNLISLRNFGTSQESDLDSNISSDSNRLYEESQNLMNSSTFSSTEKLKELCDSENERCKTPSEQIADKEMIKRKLNELNQKKLKDMANIGVPTIAEDPEIADKNDKNRPAQSQGCRPKVFKSPTVAAAAASQNPPNVVHTRPKTRNPSVNLHKLRQEINERLKREEALASMGELAAGGGWNSVNSEGESYSISSHRNFIQCDAINRRNSSMSETVRHQTTPNEYALPQPRWPCGDMNPADNEQFMPDYNHSNNNSNVVNSRRGNIRPTRKKVPKKTKAL